jgi:hypothetical protein
MLFGKPVLILKKVPVPCVPVMPVGGLGQISS